MIGRLDVRREIRHQLAAQAERKLARLVAEQRGSSGHDPMDAYPVVFTNLGPASASDVKAWIADLERKPVGGEVEVGVLLAERSTDRITLGAPTALRTERLFVDASWTDDSGPRRERLTEIDTVG